MGGGDRFDDEYDDEYDDDLDDDLDDELDDLDDPPGGYRAPLPPEDRLWRHPAEIAALAGGGSAPAGRAATSSTRRAGRRTTVMAATLGGVLLLGSLAVLLGREGRSGPPRLALDPASGVVTASSPSGWATTVADQSARGLVRVTTTGGGPAREGSAIVYRSDGVLVTTSRLVVGADAVVVTLHDGTTRPATLVGSDDVTDVAVLRIDVTGLAAGALVPVRFADDGREPAVGETLALVCSQRDGTVGAFTTRITAVDSRTQSGGGDLQGVYLTDLAAPAGIGGGAMFDADGMVLGIATEPATTGRAAAAMPAKVVQPAADELLRTGKVVHGWLGVEGTNWSSSTNGDLAETGGAAIVRVFDGSPAATAGFRAGDVITSLAGRPVGSMTTLVVALREHAPGDAVVVSVLRAGEPMLVTVTLGVRPDD